MAKHEKKPGESIDAALRKFKRQMKDEGILMELKNREFFEKPSDQKKKKFKAAQRRTYLQQKADEL